MYNYAINGFKFAQVSDKRSQMVEKIYAWGDHYHFLLVTNHVAVHILDAVLRKKPTSDKYWELVAATSLHIAVKLVLRKNEIKLT